MAPVFSDSMLIRKSAVETVANHFSQLRYSGNAGALDVVDGLKLFTDRGITITKNRSSGSAAWAWYNAADPSITYADAVGVTQGLSSNATTVLSSFPEMDAFDGNHNWFTGDARINASSSDYSTFAFKQGRRFMTVQRYTGDGVSGRLIPHGMDVTPGLVIIKSVSGTARNWTVRHKDASGELSLNLTSVAAASYTIITGVDDTNVTLSSNVLVNSSGQDYYIYCFGHDTASDGMIYCGSYTGDGVADRLVSVGFEPQFVIIKRVSGATGNWMLIDSDVAGHLALNTTSALLATTVVARYRSTGFEVSNSALVNASGSQYIFMAIRKAT